MKQALISKVAGDARTILRNIREVVKKLKHTRPTPRFCPRCGSAKLRLSSRFDLWLLPERYVCEECGYTGPVILELEETEEIYSGSSKSS